MAKPTPLPPRRHERGVALIIVLAALVLMTILVLAFLTSIGSELQSSKMYANGSSVKLLAQSSVALVTGEIQAATADQTLCWASQPGMVRTYKTDGTASAYYKLYSDDAMVAPGAFDHTKVTNLIPDGTSGTTAWYKQKGVYVDLNQPIYFNGSNYYPILDGNSADYTKTYASNLSTKTVPVATGTINSLAPFGANGLPAVTGFWLNSNTPADSTSPNIAPMPVKWLYVLKNGEVIVPDSNPVNNVVTFTKTTSQPQPSPSDPIVGRIAFWTDDETSKVNINTASEGSPANTAAGIAPSWDTPRCYSASDYNYATCQPAQNEFQRYPGHPATVSLSAVFNSLTTDTSYPENYYSTPGSPASGVAPRTTAGGSKEGSVMTPAVTGALTMLGTRLYSTVDDFAFQTSILGTPGTGTRNLNSAFVPELTPAAIQKANFFITASSEAPDVNVFNLPRVSMWPITLNSAGAPQMTAYDQLLSFCSTINGNIFYFQRQDPTSPTVDLPSTGTTTGLGRNRQLLEYLRTLTSQNIPGFGGNFAAKYGTPGDRDQILTEMFDYIRSTNLEDTSAVATKGTGTTTSTSAYAPVFTSLVTPSTTTSSLAYTGGGIGQVVPIQDATITITDPVSNASGSPSTTTSNPRGFGRFPTLQQASIVFIGAGNSDTPSPTSTPPLPNASNPNPPTSYTPAITDTTKERVQAALFLQMYNPAQGTPVTRPSYKVTVSHLENLLWNGQSIFPTSASFPYASVSGGNGVSGSVQPTACDVDSTSLPSGSKGYAGINIGGMHDFRAFSILRGSVASSSSGLNSSFTSNGGFNSPLYPFVSPPTGQIATDPDLPRGGTFNFSSSGDVVVQIYALNASGALSSSTPIQTLYLNFPSGIFPVPASVNNDGTLNYAAPTPNPVAAHLPLNTNQGGSFAIGNYPTYDFLSFIDTWKGTSASGSAPFPYGAGRGRLDFPANSIWFSNTDTVRAVVASDPSQSTSAATAGDARLIAARQVVPDNFFQPITGTQFPSTADYKLGSVQFSHFLRILTGLPFYGSISGRLIYGAANANYSGSVPYLGVGTAQYLNGSVSATNPDTTFTNWGGSSARPKDPIIVNQNSSVYVGNDTTLKIAGDWDNGIENAADGAYINRPDEGDTGIWATGSSTYSTNGYPYFELDYGQNLPGANFFSPNRMIPSAGMFGSLPTGVWHDKAWQTLLFRPGPANHPGLGTRAAAGTGYTSPPDHLFLDLFNMPVVEPYAISTPLATAGRINMNYLIVPFTYINRDTGLRAAMKNQMIASIPTAKINGYKVYTNTAGGTGAAIPSTRFTINLDLTLSQFLARFYNTTNSQGANGAPDIFHSASEICNIDLVPNDTTVGTSTYLTLPITRTNMDNYWTANGLTGDNSRERPYANLYPLLTTKSNTFTVHFRVQTLKQALTGAAATPTAWQSWREGTDVVTSEYRGSQTIERYVDPNAATVSGVSFPDYASPSTISSATFPPTTPLSSFYKFRVVSSKQFPP